MDPILESPVDVGDTGVALDEAPSGLPIIALPSALTGLHYFDGQAMRDVRLTTEQNYRRALAALAARSGGYGVASGLDVQRLTSDTIRVGAGLAVDGLGRVLQLPVARTISMTGLIAASRITPMAMAETASTSPEFLRCIRLWTKRPVSARASTVLWVVGASWTEASAAVGSGTVMREGIRLRAVPLVFRTPVARSRQVALDARAHLRSLVASAVFNDEWVSGGSLVSGEGLRRGAWCLGAQWDSRADVPLAVVASAGDEILFVDEWMVRRERHEAPPSRYWAGLMRMRPWSAYLAQVLQFQCQLSDVGVPGAVLRSRGCDDTTATIATAATYVSNVYALWQAPQSEVVVDRTPQQELEGAMLLQTGGATRLEALTREIVSASIDSQRVLADRLLIRHGIVELPPSGYLPVSAGKEVPTVNAQVRALMGEGVDIRCCIVHPDVVAHELEEGQHMERISLLTGLDDPTRKPAVDIFVPDGVAVAAPPPTDRYEVLARVATASLGSGVFGGTGRREALDGGGAALHVAASSVVAALVELLIRNEAANTEAANTEAANTEAANAEPNAKVNVAGAAGAIIDNAPIERDAAAAASESALWITVRTDKAIRSLGLTESAHLTGRAVLATSGESETGQELTFDGKLTVRASADSAPDTRVTSATVVGTLAVIRRSAGTDGDLSVLASQRLSLTVDMHWRGDETSGAMIARILTPQFFGARAVPLATVEKLWGEPAGRTSIAVLASPLVAELFGDNTTESSGATNFVNERGSFDETPAQFVVLELIENANVVREDNPLHRLATAAVQNVQALLDTETTFARDALLALFPPLPAPKLLVQATRDWVLFRRRRERRVVPWVDPLTVGVRRYRLLSVTAGSDAEARKLASSLRPTDATIGGAFRGSVAGARSATPVLIEFLRDGASPLIDAQELRNAFATLQPGKTIAAGIIASSRDEGPELLTRRLRTLTPLLAPDTLTEASAPMIAIASPPPDLITLDADGVILLVTV